MNKNRSLVIILLTLITISGLLFIECKDPKEEQLTGAVTIAGTAEVGQILYANTNYLNGNGQFNYEWKRNGITIGYSNYYYVQYEDIGYNITVTVTCYGYSGSVTSSPTTAVKLPAITGTVTITGTAHVGETLTANTASLGGSGTITYQWKRGTTNIGTNSSTYVIQSADVGSTITVTVSRASYSGSITSSPTASVILPPISGTVTITGTAQRGQVLTANTTSLGDSGTISYQWRRGTSTTNIGTGSTYTLQQADVGYTIKIIVSRANNSGNIESTSTSTVIDFPALTGTVSITGTAQRGQTLSVDTTNLSGSGTISYQWRRGTGTTNIGTSSTYTVQQADVGYTLTVIVTRANNSSDVRSSTVTVIDLPVITGTVSITGTAEVGQTLTANTSVLGGTGTISYQWQRGSTIIGTNSSTYTIQAADVGSAITVIVTRSGNSGSITSPSIMAVSTKGTETNPYNLVENVWMDGSITTSVNEIWYSFNANASTTYRVWWNNDFYSDGTKTLRAEVRAYNSSGTELFDATSGGWDSPRTINVISSGTIYLKVTPIYSGYTGTFAIVYSTGSTRP